MKIDWMNIFAFTKMRFFALLVILLGGLEAANNAQLLELIGITWLPPGTVTMIIGGLIYSLRQITNTPAPAILVKKNE